uniref:Uncharacterized protein n=1 Tax=Alloyangia mangrovi TaxID=1779329 RepID=A0A2A3JYQ9_9RHOB
MATSEPTHNLPTGFAHDGEHPLVQMPFTVLIGTRQLRGESLSLTRAHAGGLMPRSSEERVTPMTLRFDLEGFSVSLYLDARITADPSEDGRVVLHFTDPTGAHLPPLRYLLNSYIAGDVVSVGGMLGYTGPVSFKSKPAAVVQPALHRVAGLGRRGLVMGLTAALAIVAAGIVHERLVYAYEPRPVILTEGGQTMRATAAGQLSYVDPDAQFGEVVYSILANSGDLLSVKMPCDCRIAPLEAFASGATVLPGTPLLDLLQSEGTLTASTEITFEGSARALAGAAPSLCCRMSPGVLTSSAAAPPACASNASSCPHRSPRDWR